ncbi:MAG: fatty-acid oxidation protein subunit alpha [Planctomycetota bacterium]|nr:MAG: fatty-acid oxidation protein subunit alpha [Planctomycetota bacterium]
MTEITLNITDGRHLEGSYFRCIIEETGLATILFDTPNEKVNKLSEKALIEFHQIVSHVSTRNEVKVLIIKSKKASNFIAGADIEEINLLSRESEATEKAAAGQAIFQSLSNLPFPTVAIIHGACVGGGLELALACDYRIASDHSKTKIGLPEVGLGVVPGFGGTQRLPRLIGLVNGLTLILTYKLVDAKKAYKLKIIDAVYAHEFFNEKADEFVAEIFEKGKSKKALKRRKLNTINKLSQSFLLRWYVFKNARKGVMAKTKGAYPAPLEAIELIKNTWSLKPEEGFAEESRVFGKLSQTAISKNLIKLYFINEDLKKEGVSTEEVEEIRKMCVLGAGVMGGGIAWLFSHKGRSVRMKDLSWDAIGMGFKSCQKIYKDFIKRRRLKKSEVNIKMNLISGTLDFTGFKEADVVVEAIVENIEIKKKVLQELEPHIGEDCIIATNTSALSVKEMSTALKNPERFIGMHFFNPVSRMPLVEVIPVEETSDEVIFSTMKFIRDIGKTPILVKDCPGFLVNRVLIPYVNEAVFLLEEGANLELVDEIMVDFGMPMGPFELADNVGLDVGYKVAKILEESYGERMVCPKFLENLHNLEGVLGKKTKKGFYSHKGKKLKLNKEVMGALKNFQNTSEITIQEITHEEIETRLIYGLIAEAIRCVEEKVVSKPEFLDMAMLMGTGFPPFKGGVLRYADSIGLKNILYKLKELKSAKGKRFDPPELLLSMVNRSETFY